MKSSVYALESVSALICNTGVSERVYVYLIIKEYLVLLPYIDIMFYY